jgi:hypothetical protein
MSGTMNPNLLAFAQLVALLHQHATQASAGGALPFANQQQRAPDWSTLLSQSRGIPQGSIDPRMIAPQMQQNVDPRMPQAFIGNLNQQPDPPSSMGNPWVFPAGAQQPAQPQYLPVIPQQGNT